MGAQAEETTVSAPEPETASECSEPKNVFDRLTRQTTISSKRKIKTKTAKHKPIVPKTKRSKSVKSTTSRFNAGEAIGNLRPKANRSKSTKSTTSTFDAGEAMTENVFDRLTRQATESSRLKRQTSK